jgi:hypothetical protein
MGVIGMELSSGLAKGTKLSSEAKVDADGGLIKCSAKCELNIPDTGRKLNLKSLAVGGALRAGNRIGSGPDSDLELSESYGLAGRSTDDADMKERGCDVLMESWRGGVRLLAGGVMMLGPLKAALMSKTSSESLV